MLSPGPLLTSVEFIRGYVQLTAVRLQGPPTIHLGARHQPLYHDQDVNTESQRVTDINIVNLELLEIQLNS